MLIVDASHWQADIDAAALKAAGVVACIHKCTEVMRYKGPVDEYYESNRARCIAAGLLWGGYLYIDPTDGAAQADFFLDTFKQDGLMAIDVEERGLTLQQVEACILRLYARTGIYPLLYTSFEVLMHIGGLRSAVLAKCRLWLAGKPYTIPPMWSGYTLLQFDYLTSQGKQFDLNRFDGTLDELKGLWTMTTPTTDIVKQVVALASSRIATFKEAGGDLHHFIQAGDVVSADYSIQKTVNGETFIQSPDDFWLAKDNLPPGPDPLPVPDPTPVPTPVVRYTTVVLNLRSAPNTSASVVITMSANSKVTATYPATTDAYHWVAVTYTNPATGKTYAGYAASTDAKTGASYLSPNPR